MVRKQEEEQPPESVWSYRGYSLKSSEFTTAMVHFFRAEVSRANAWRQRLDATTNWAVVTTGAVLSFAFAQAEFGHFVIPRLKALAAQEDPEAFVIVSPAQNVYGKGFQPLKEE